MQKFSQFYVTYRNIVQFEYKLWKLDYFEKSVLELMADPVVQNEKPLSCVADVRVLVRTLAVHTE